MDFAVDFVCKNGAELRTFFQLAPCKFPVATKFALTEYALDAVGRCDRGLLKKPARGTVLNLALNAFLSMSLVLPVRIRFSRRPYFSPSRFYPNPRCFAMRTTGPSG